MFQGIIEQMGRVAGRSGRVLTILPHKIWRARVGESVAVDGVCLSVTRQQGGRLFFDLGAETLRCTNLAASNPGRAVNLERPLKFGRRINGHFVLGHVDGIGFLDESRKIGRSVILSIRTRGAWSRLLASKSSVAVNGVSLTINKVRRFGREAIFEVCLIPQTQQSTNLAKTAKGWTVNVEADYLSRLGYNNSFFHGQKS